MDLNGEIEYSEFLAATLSRDLYCTSEKIESAFSGFDRNNSGTIEVDDIMNVLAGSEVNELEK